MSDDQEQTKTPFYTDAEQRAADQTARDNLARTEAAETEYKQQKQDRENKQQ